MNATREYARLTMVYGSFALFLAADCLAIYLLYNYLGVL